MSALYNLEPQPTAKVLLRTTAGDILLELFAKQTPLASRNFLQLCLDGYYNGTVFHRLVPGFIIQGGDPTGTGEGGEAIYDGGLFADEFHSRLRFNRRGLLGMANTGKKDDNGSQFFLTLGKTEELNGRNTMFGRVVGDTIYNLMKMGESDLVGGEGSERPLYPTTITGAEVLVNPFEGMTAREVRATAKLVKEKRHDKKKPKKAPKTLLSFGEEGQDVILPITSKAKFNTKLIVAAPESTATIDNTKEIMAPQEKTRKAIRREYNKSASPPPKLNSHPQTQLPLPNDENPSRHPSTSPEPTEVKRVSSLLDHTNAQIVELKASMKRSVPSAPPESRRKKSALEQMMPETSIRGRKRKHGANGNSSGDTRALEILAAFREKLDKAPTEAPSQDSPIQEPRDERPMITGDANGDGAIEDDEEVHLCDLHFIAHCQSCQSWDQHMNDNVEPEDEDGKGWMSHVLTFEKDRLGKDLTWKRKNEEELVVIDPREKAKDIKEEQKAKRLAKGLVPSSRAWDHDRGPGAR